MTRVLPLPAPARMSTGPSSGFDGLALLRIELGKERQLGMALLRYYYFADI